RWAFGKIGALHAVAEVVHHLGDAGHADAPDADEVNRADVGADALHPAAPPAKAGAALAGLSLATRITSWIGEAPKIWTRSARSRAALGRLQFQAACAAVAGVSGSWAMALICLASSLAVKLDCRIARAPP